MLYGQLPEVEFDGKKASGFLFRVPNPPKEAVLRLPTSEEITGYLDLQRTLQYNLGRRKSKSERVPNPKSDLALFAKLKVAGADFDEFEARNAIGKLTFTEVLSCVRSGELYRIALKTPFCETTHDLAVPTAKQLSVYRRSVLDPKTLSLRAELDLTYKVGQADPTLSFRHP